MRDGVMLLLGKVDTAGRKLEVLAEAEEPVSPSQLKPPATWRRFQTQAGNYYYYDPDTEIVHYLTKSGASRRLLPLSAYSAPEAVISACSSI